MAIYACGVLAGITAGYLILTHHLRQERRRCKDVSVRIWGLSGPLGAFICAWGGVAMLASAPFDDWWHNAYGLDVRIISPPHMVLAAGFFGIEFGTVMLMLAFMNRAGASAASGARAACSCTSAARCSANRCCSRWSTSAAPISTTRRFYIVVMIGTPGDPRRAGDRVRAQRGRCTIIAGVYTRVRRWRSCGSCRCFRPSRSSGRCTAR